MKTMGFYFLLTLGFLYFYARGEYVSFDGGNTKVWGGYANAKITLKVVDQDGSLVEGASVKAGLFNSKYKNVRQPFNGVTDTNGIYIIEGSTIQDVTYSVEKDGYYYTRGIYDFRDSAPAGEQAVIDGKWQPWNSIQTVILKQIKNPTPLFVKSAKAELPKEDAPLGYDLLQGDWVAPYGEGEIPDFIFLSNRIKSGKVLDIKLSLDFSNEGDGIQLFKASPDEGSYFRFPYLAPENSYQTNLTQRMGRQEDGSHYGFESPEQSEKNYFFRVRSVLDKDGSIISALYGKISGQINIQGAGRDSAKIVFSYYLNPTPNDRNLEFDTKKNLFKNLTFWEEMISGP